MAVGEISNQEILNEYLVWCSFEKRFSKETISNYRNTLRRFIKFLDSQKIHVNSVDLQMIRTYMISLRDKGIKGISFNDYRSVIKSFYNYLVNRKQIEENPVTKTPKQVERKPKKDVLSMPQLIQLIEKINDDGTYFFRDTIMFELFWNSGLRVSELISLRLNDLELSEIYNEKKKQRQWIYEIKVVEGKGGKDRFVPIGETTTFLIRKYLVGRSLRFATSYYLFPNTRGEKMNRRQAYEIIRGFLKLTTTKKKGPHVLRHAYATMLLNQGVNILAVQKLLGHSRVATTTIYAKPSQEALMMAYNMAHPKGDPSAVKETKKIIPVIHKYRTEKTRGGKE